MKLTLLEIVQNILSSMDSDEVNSVSDTTESLQVLSIVKENYYDILSRANLPEHYKLFELDPSGNINKPTLLSVPTNVNELLWVKYDVGTPAEPDFKDLTQLSVSDFINLTYAYDKTASEFFKYTHNIDGDIIDIMCYNNLYPRYYTILSDRTIVFDSYDNTVDDTIQKSKTLAYGQTFPTFESSDTYVPDLDAKQFPLLLAESKRQAFVELKQSQNPNAEQKARRGWIRSQIDKSVDRPTGHSKVPNYGRK